MVYLRGKKWWVKLYRGGKMIRLSTGLEDRARAEQVERTLKLAYDVRPERASIDAWLDTIYGKSAGLAFADSWDRYASAAREMGHAPTGRTQAARRSRWEAFAKWCGTRGLPDVEHVTRADALDYAASLADGSRKDKTRKNIIDDLSAVWKVLGTVCKLANVWDGLQPKVRDAAVREGWTHAEAERLLAAARTEQGGRWYLPSLISLHTGLRLSSIRALRWDEIGPDWVLRHTPPKTEAHGVKVVIPIVSVLRRELERERAAHPRAEFVVPDRDIGLNIDKRFFSEVVRAAGIDAGVRTFHSWRHTFRTRLAEAGVSDDIAKRLGGWTQDATARRYDHAERIKELQEAVEKTASEKETQK